MVLNQTALSQTVQSGKSYVNITKGVNGGTIEPGDTLEIRATIAVGGGNITVVHYVDTIPANTTYIPQTLRILTNEGLVFKSFTDASGDDPAYYNATGGTLRINLGSTYNNGGSVVPGGNCNNTIPWSVPDGGTIQSNGRPSFYGSTCILSASFRIRVNTGLAYGSYINLYSGAFYYKTGGSPIKKPCSAYSIQLKENSGLCPNSVGTSALLENAGTFGSGTTQNRSTSAIVPGYNFQNVGDNAPNDGSYAITNNLSPSGSTITNSAKPYTGSPQRRVFGHWDIMGDHTGAANPLTGNAPVAPGTAGGYFVAINASYANSNAIQQTVSGLCPNTYYEFSAWFKNVCQYCACDSFGTSPYNNGSPNSAFKGVDSSGVNPNLTFTVDGVDYYTTGSLKYTGQWVKKGFIYMTGPSQTSFTITIRNNAAGGGGNDWALDDVTLATCTPNLNLQPSPALTVCSGQSVDMSAIIRCYFPNYIYWRWEKSTDGGANWTNTGISGTGTPVLNGGEYEYTATYPTFLADNSLNNTKFRIRIGSSPANLNDDNCSFSAVTTITITTINCTILPGDFKEVYGQVNNGTCKVSWSIVNETAGTDYEIESSTDQQHFIKAGTVSGFGEGMHNYQFTDPAALNGERYYRIKLSNGTTQKYSRTILLSNTTTNGFTIRSIVNPITDKLSMELVSASKGQAQATITDVYGHQVRSLAFSIAQGSNTLVIPELERLAAGIYFLQLKMNENMILKRLLKP